VEKVFVKNGQLVEAGDPLFNLRDSTQLAAVEVAESQVTQTEAAFEVARSELAAAEGMVKSAKGSLQQAQNELRVKQELREKNAGIVSDQELQRLTHTVSSRVGALASAVANQGAMAAKLSVVLPSQQASSRETLEQAEVELGKTTVFAGVKGRVHQFFLLPGDYVNPILRPAGLLIPTENMESGRHMVQAGFSQLSAQVIHKGTVAEISCLSKPFTVIPMVVTNVQEVIAAGQVRPTDQLIDILDRARPGTLTVWMEPLYEGGLDGVLPGTKCIANAYTNNHELIVSGELDALTSLYLHMVDAVGVVHAVILRIQTLMPPMKMLVFSGH
jgi:multidrug resistance efflux pump